MDYSEMRQLLGDRIRFLRKEKGITQEQLAELVDKTTEHISYLERGERSPSFELLVDLAHALNVSLSYLLDITPPEESFKIAIPAPVPTNQLPDTVVEPIKPQAQRKTDLERMKEAFEKVQELQLLANEYGISDIFQDNGGKVLQVMIMLGLKISPGREGNDAVDEENNEYELKTVNYALSKQVTTHHHMNEEIIDKYRKVKAWCIAIYSGIEILEIWNVHPAKLEELFQRWEAQIIRTGKELNNPKIPLWFVQTGGECVYRNPNMAAPIPLESEPRWRVKERMQRAQPKLLDFE